MFHLVSQQINEFDPCTDCGSLEIEVDFGRGIQYCVSCGTVLKEDITIGAEIYHNNGYTYYGNIKNKNVC